MTPNNSRRDQTAGGGPSQIPLAEGHGPTLAQQRLADLLARQEREQKSEDRRVFLSFGIGCEL